MKALTCGRGKFAALPLRVFFQRISAQHSCIRKFRIPLRIACCEHVFALRHFGTDIEGNRSVHNAVLLCFRKFWALYWSGRPHLVALVCEDVKHNKSTEVVHQLICDASAAILSKIRMVRSRAQRHKQHIAMHCPGITGQAAPDNKAKHCLEK